MSKFRPGTIVKIKDKETPWKFAEGLFIKYTNEPGIAKVFWYIETGMTLHWCYKDLRVKSKQVISPQLSLETKRIVEQLKQYIENAIFRF